MQSIIHCGTVGLANLATPRNRSALKYEIKNGSLPLTISRVHEDVMHILQLSPELCTSAASLVVKLGTFTSSLDITIFGFVPVLLVP